MEQPPGPPPPTDQSTPPPIPGPKPAANNVNPESSLASPQANITVSPPVASPPAVPLPTISSPRHAAPASPSQAPGTPSRSREFQVVLSPRRQQQPPPSVPSPPPVATQPSAAAHLPPPLPPMPRAEGESRSRKHAREMLARLHPRSVVFASRCARCRQKSEVCWGSSSGDVSVKCGPCIYAGRTCELARDQVSYLSHLAGLANLS
jgi:hypothetical protein